MEHNYWYATMQDSEDADWGSGSFSLDTAKDTVQKWREGDYPDAYIAVIDVTSDNPNHQFCVDEIHEFEPSTEKRNHDAVNHPGYYTDGKIEVLDFITDKKLNFCRGNAVKYIVRAGKKDPDKEIEDLQKAVFYINKEIEELEANAK